METNGAAAAFDALFSRIDAVAICPQDGRQPEEYWIPPDEGTRLTPIRQLGENALKFMIFSSKTKSLENGKYLYSPSITVFLGDPQDHRHIVRSDLEIMPNSQAAIEKQKALLAKLENARELFDQYEQIESKSDR